MTQAAGNLDLAKQLYSSIDAADFERAQTLISPRFQACVGGNKLEFGAWKAMGQMFMSAFPDGRHVFDLMEVAGDYVFSHGNFTGTHKKEFQGIPATGRVINCSFTMIDKIVDGKLVQHYGDLDAAGLMQQLMK